MAKKIISNAFGISMLPVAPHNFVRLSRITSDKIPANVESAIDRADIAKVVSGILGFKVEPNHVRIRLKAGDILYVVRYVGKKIPKGATTLPDGAVLEFYEVTYNSEGCQGCHGYDTGDCQDCKTSFWLSGADMKDC